MDIPNPSYSYWIH